MIAITFIICLTVIIVVAIICYKDYKIQNNGTLSRVNSKLKSLRTELEINDRIIGHLADSISYLKKQDNDN